MHKLVAGAIAFLVVGSTIGSGVANAHQPLNLLDSDTTASKGPLIADGTLSFAVQAAFTKAGQKKAFSAQFKEGEELAVQYLIVDKKPESALRKKSLPKLVITSPSGSKVIMKLKERTKFFEPYGGVNYLFLGRYNSEAQSGIYSFEITSKRRAAITIAVGEKEGIVGEVIRGTYGVPKPVASATPKPVASATPTPTPKPTAEQSGYTMEKVRANNSGASCWSVIDGNVYDLTKWIASHPGGRGNILSLCGKNGTAEFAAKHRGDSNPQARLRGFLLGPLAS
ncbi:MAG: cytochrome b5-like heme/steroid binding domain-containing protein [Actinobacteria bacterium]|nr:cytochrome b5-like heme/steroid binding domain-containing protein [Actinomycetota bacterium]MDA2982111.1 cytochrome b5-like heme/steroid binding domain-containing protein [Actinomycetota bacterium]MDA2996047.1 cytochrome b5-like heme/steroid binding domain-containing protein [Actinomycetota bacterium]